ncbi:MAG: hypothetical protein ABIP75_18435 [Pyrinomonadaceae bacterium]
MFNRILAAVFIAVLASITLAQTASIGDRVVLSPDSKRATRITPPLVLIDNDGEYLDVVISGRYEIRKPQPVPDGLDLTFFSRSAEPHFRHSHRLTMWADGEMIDLGRTNFAEFSAVEVGGKTTAIAKLAPEQRIEPFAPADSRILLSRGDRKLIGELMVREGLTFDQWFRVNAAAKLEIKLGAVTIKLDPSQRQLLRDFTARLTPANFRLRPEKVDADLVRRQTAAPSTANQATLEATLKWLTREAGTGNDRRNATPGAFVRGVEFSSCKLTYRVEFGSTATRPSTGNIPGFEGLAYVQPFTIVNLNLAELDPDLVAIKSSDRSEGVSFQTVSGNPKIHLEFRGGMQMRTQVRERAADKWKNSESLDVRDHRLAPQFAEAFAHAITLCQQRP